MILERNTQKGDVALVSLAMKAAHSLDAKPIFRVELYL